MKKTVLLILFLAPVLFTSCRKDPENVSKVVKVSYPTVELKGDKYVTLNVGQAYDDPGAVSVDDVSGTTSNISADISTLDVSTPGLYYLQYTAINANGYQTKAGRYIAVTNYNDEMNLEGVYMRLSNGIEINVSKVSRGLYMIDDMGGAGLPDAAYFAVIDNETIDFAPQLSESIGEEIDAVGEELIVDPPDTALSYALRAPGYGTATRTFIKQ